MRLNAHWSKFWNNILTVVIVLTPFLATTLLFKILFNATLHDFQIFWSDEILYWLEINTFKFAGFNGGYFSAHEMIASAGFSHFGPHGPVYAVFMGLLTRLFGWTLTSGPIYNIVFVSLGILIFVLLTNPVFKQKIFLFFIVLLSYPILLFIPTMMQESINHALAFVIGGIFIRLSASKSVSSFIKILGIATVIFAALLRLNSVFFYFPLIFLLGKRRNLKWLFLSAGIATVISLLHCFLYWWWTSPFQSSFIYQWLNMDMSPTWVFIVFFLEHTYKNIIKFVSIHGMTNPIHVLQRFISIAFIIVMGFFICKKKKQFYVPLFLLIANIMFSVFIYDVGMHRDLRMIAPSVIISLLFLLYYIEDKFITSTLSVTLIISLFFFPNFIANCKTEFHQAHLPKTADDLEYPVENSAFTSMEYQEGSDPWCNSLLSDYSFTARSLTIPAGIGLNYIVDANQVELPVHSHYLYLTEDLIKKYLLTGKVEVLETKGTDAGRILYRQLQDGCNN